MPYESPRGWIETLSEPGADVLVERFHARSDCGRIKRGELRAVDRPYSAARCAGCADVHGSNRDTVG